MNLPMNFGSLDFGDWAYGLGAAFIGGGASAVTSGVVVSLKDPGHYNFETLAFYELVLAVFVASGLLNAMAFLRQKPLPEFKTVTTTVERTEVQSVKPPVTVVTTVQETSKLPIDPVPPTEV